MFVLLGGQIHIPENLLHIDVYGQKPILPLVICFGFADFAKPGIFYKKLKMKAISIKAFFLKVSDQWASCRRVICVKGMACVSLGQSAAETSAAVVQRQQEKSPLTQSHFTLQSTDPVRAVERYFEESAQMLVRVALLDDGRGVFVQPMPGHDFGPLDGLSDAELVDRCFALSDNDRAKLLDEVVLFYGCRCSDAMILDMITSLPAQQRLGLWKGSESLTINCPRCNRAYTISKTLETS